MSSSTIRQMFKGGTKKTSTASSEIEDHMDMVPTIRLLAASWAGLIKDGMEAAAAEVEKLGKLVYGDGLFKAAMSDAVGGLRDNA
ncbi:hypothetical protein B0A55_01515 [Friedmanniomyces simplex]|uniref:Uncharacterized protein n=1 Tax=Friedmanniomyces simplex TaxID=329884 RepID=A0A4U0XYP2_9PEZI|nr:hypothetical protein B0A55_01515 [Friedmanniomyces simplex]